MQSYQVELYTKIEEEKMVTTVKYKQVHRGASLIKKKAMKNMVDRPFLSELEVQIIKILNHQ